MKWTVAINYDYDLYIVDNIISYHGKNHVIKLVLAQLDLYLNLVSKQRAEDFENIEILEYTMRDGNICWESNGNEHEQEIGEIEKELMELESAYFGDVAIVIFETPPEMLKPGPMARLLCSTNSFNL